MGFFELAHAVIRKLAYLQSQGISLRNVAITYFIDIIMITIQGSPEKTAHTSLYHTGVAVPTQNKTDITKMFVRFKGICHLTLSSWIHLKLMT